MKRFGVILLNVVGGLVALMGVVLASQQVPSVLVWLFCVFIYGLAVGHQLSMRTSAKQLGEIAKRQDKLLHDQEVFLGVAKRVMDECSPFKRSDA